MINPKKAVMEMEPYNPPTSGREGKLRLDFNENTIGCSPTVLKYLKRLNCGQLSVYPEYSCLRKKLAAYCKVRFSQIIATNATDEAIKLVMDTYIEKGDEIVLPIPTFAMFKFYAQLSEAKIVEVMYNTDLSFPTRKVLEKINKKTRLVVLVNPNNPTGSAISCKDILKIVKKARKNSAFILIDEAYCQFYGKSSKKLISKYGNVIVVQTFSKAFGLAGIRLGYIMSCVENIKSLLKANSPYSVNSVAILAAIGALDDLGYVNKYIREVKKSKKLLCRELKNLGLKVYPTSANFVVVKFGDRCGYVYQKLKEKNILVRDISKYPLLKGCLRIGIGTRKQTRCLIKTLGGILNKTLLFDIDGVLVDVSKSYRIAIKKTAEYFLQKEVILKEIQDFKNKIGYNNDWDLTETIIKKMGKRIKKKKIINKFQEFYLGGLIDQEKWLLDKRLLRKLSLMYKLGIVTGRPRKEAEYVLKRNKVRRYFKVLVAMEDCAKSKPDPSCIMFALEKSNSTNVVYIGDTINDLLAAKNAGVGFIGVNNSFLRDKCDYIPNLNKILEVIK